MSSMQEGQKRQKVALGSIWDGLEEGQGPRGRDLVWTARVRRSELRAGRLRIEVPLELRTEDGVPVRRALVADGAEPADSPGPSNASAADSPGPADDSGPSLSQGATPAEDEPAAPESAPVEVSAPADLPSGARLRLRGLGEPMDEGRAGDLHLRLRIEEDALARSGWQTFREGPGPALIGLGVFAILLIWARIGC